MFKKLSLKHKTHQLTKKTFNLPKINLLNKKIFSKLQNSKIFKKLFLFIENESIEKKISNSFKFIIILTAIAMICSTISIISMASRTNKLYTSPYAVSNTISNIKYNLKDLDDNLYKAISTNETSKRNYSIDLSNAAAEDLKKNIETLNKISAEDNTLLQSLSENIKILEPIRQDACNLIKEGKKERAIKLLESSYSLTMELNQNIIQDISNQSEVDAEKFVSSSNIYRNLSVIAIIIFIIIILFIASLVEKLLRQKLIEGINNIKNISKNLLEGNLKIDSTYTSNDEMGEMCNDLITSLKMLTSYVNDITSTLERLSNSDLNINLDNSICYKGDFSPIQESLARIVTSLNSTFHQIREAIGLIANSSEQLSGTTQMLSEGSASQAEAVEDLLSSFTKILTQVQKNTDNAYKANSFSDKTKDIVTDGRSKMNDLMKSMKEITNSSKQIAEIVNTIEEIASQTNLLALNAAIEAARAGDAGKGFAVVADEVKRLAAQSSEAVKNTTIIISNSLHAVMGGEKLAQETADALNIIVKNVDDTANLVKQIATESKDQADAIEKMTSRVHKISDVVQTNSATAEETAASTQELASQSQLINDKLSIYKLKN
ncbi:methyl-accepting chemotaxis protein II [Clostridium puniceum]|uniref:Methyl-accepting chemotaxis protein II n=1 Tax=Clostridium puniceum TaxID=29367 RepID=A0A1S8TGD1_9CLOT|nr:methyl-accepting chemotaxis protein [Clostridium puniceum]OOM76679.1 methyl-accepting chemotaxis protein II [Clostridium puniceum]